jgi:hypothetical protein
MSSQHKHNPIPFRPPAGDRAWLLAHAAETGRAVNAVLAEALVQYRQRAEQDKCQQQEAAPDG